MSELVSSRDRLRVAVIGCGAVAEKYHIPIIAGHERALLSAMVDRSLGRAKELGTAYRVPLVTDSIERIDRSNTDAAILCTPPFHHAPAALDLIAKGIHVLVEKPIATTFSDAEKVVEAAVQSKVVLSVAVFRRLLPSLRLLKKALDSELLGPPESFHVQGGAVYGWEAVSLGNMLKAQAGGGVLMDMGPHYFDQLLYLFNGPSEVLEYQDDSRGGIEANCKAKLGLTFRGTPIEGVVEISRTHAMPNEFVVTCRDGDLVIPPSDRFRVLIRKKDWRLQDNEGNSGNAEFSMAWTNEPETLWLKNFRDEIDDWIDAIAQKKEPKLSGRSALPVMKLIDDCYSLRQGLSFSWESHPFMDLVANIDAKVLSTHRKVLITGASGFIGCRLAEILAQRTGYEVRSAVHNPANASRLARLNTEMVQADLSDIDSVKRIVAGCDAIVHCAIGTETGNRQRVFEVTVGGTKNLVKIAELAGVGHLVHISSIAVHADDLPGKINEFTPTHPGKGNTYGESKLEAERCVRKGKIPFTIIRPGCVYGPYGKTFITNPIRAMAQGRLILSGSVNTASNTLYVDSLCEAIIRSLENNMSVGKTYTLADDDGMTWGEFYGYFASRFGMSFCTIDEIDRSGSGGVGIGSNGGSLKDLARSEEVKAVLKAFAWKNSLGIRIRQFIEKKRVFKKYVKKVFGLSGSFVYRSELAIVEQEPFYVLPRAGVVCSDLIRQELGWKPLLTRQDCLRFVGDWIDYSNICR